MCRWLAYIGSPIKALEVLGSPRNSLIHQSLDSHLGAEPTNGDGWGMGWYVQGHDTPARYRSVEPMWNDQNLQDAARYLTSGCMVTHVRAAIGSTVQRTNSHPFRHDRWLFAHNGYVDGWPLVHRELAMAIDPSLFHELAGSTDSEILFLLALTFGLETDPHGALERMAGVVEQACERVGARDGLQMTLVATDGEQLHVVRHATRGQARSLFQSTDIAALQKAHPDNVQLANLPIDGHAVVSEPLGDLRGAWEEIPPSSYVRVSRAGSERHDFVPAAVAA